MTDPVGDAIRDAEHGEKETAYRNQLARESYVAGYEAGHKTGYEAGVRAAEAAMAQRWREASAPVARGGPSHAAKETARWGPGGRAAFAQPRPGDFPGRGQQPEREAEAG